MPYLHVLVAPVRRRAFQLLRCLVLLAVVGEQLNLREFGQACGSRARRLAGPGVARAGWASRFMHFSSG